MSYVLNTPEDQRAMLELIGAKSIDDLFRCIPETVQLGRPLEVPPALSEIELSQHMQELAAMNRAADSAVCFLGGGAYDHFIPAVVDAVSSRSEYYTAYTPYQAEASQGSLQAFFEFQSLICQLTGMEVANASLYDGGSAVAEAALMAMSINNRSGKVLVAESVHPEYRATLDTYLVNLEPKQQVLPTPQGYLDPADLEKAIDDQTVCVIVQHPNFFGCLEEVEELARIAHEKGSLFVVSFDPISLGLLKRPGQYGADIAIAEGQCLGNPLVFGGPYLGILACREEYVRKMPGRLVGQTVDRNGKRCWVLTLQTREQHIRREKATSNICTNQGLFALRAAVYLAALGPQGLKQTAELCTRLAHYAADKFAKLPVVSRIRFDRPFFKEFTIELDIDKVGTVTNALPYLLKAGYHAGLALERWYPSLAGCLTVAVTEKRTRNEIDGLATALTQLGMPASSWSNVRESVKH
ncbi:MAG: aminomethyl-transferring glycine dehydrogenase subunit GcvPA [Gemmataceae bacterium]